MKIRQAQWTRDASWTRGFEGEITSPQLILLFGGVDSLRDEEAIGELRRRWPDALLFGCTTAGEICDVSVSDDSLVATAIEFEHTRTQIVRTSLDESGGSFEAGELLGRALEKDQLTHVFVLSDGLDVNGSALIKGLTRELPDGVTITGGLSGDGGRFEETYVRCGDEVERGLVVALGLYGSALQVGYASLGGWDPFGPERVITRSEGNVLYEVDGKPVLDLYKRYLGEHASGLPATGLLFPLAIRSDRERTPVVRTILGVDEEEKSMTFAGDVPEGSLAQLMRANFERLVDGAGDAARNSHEAIGSVTPELAILISCVGRKMVLKQRIEEEVEAVRDVLGEGAVLTGFYSYGEISPFTPEGSCELHNQTMTITLLTEKKAA